MEARILKIRPEKWPRTDKNWPICSLHWQTRSPPKMNPKTSRIVKELCYQFQISWLHYRSFRETKSIGLVPYKEHCVVSLNITEEAILSYVNDDGFLEGYNVDISIYEYEGFDPVKFVNHYSNIFRTKRASLFQLAAIVYTRGHNFKRMLTRMPDAGKAIVLRTLADLGLSSTPGAGKLNPLSRTAQRFLSCVPVMSLKISLQHECRMINGLPPWLRSSVGYGLAHSVGQKRSALYVALKKTIITNTRIADLPRAFRISRRRGY